MVKTHVPVTRFLSFPAPLWETKPDLVSAVNSLQSKNKPNNEPQHFFWLFEINEFSEYLPFMLFNKCSCVDPNGVIKMFYLSYGFYIYCIYCV